MAGAVSRYYRWVASSSGSATPPPAAPTLSVTDTGDGTGGTATIAGSTAGTINTVYYLTWTSTAGALVWLVAGSRTGNGTVALTQQGALAWYCGSVNAGGQAISNLFYRPLTAPTSGDAWEDRLADAVVAELNDPARGWAALFATDSVTAVRTRAPWYKAPDLATLKVAAVPLTIARERLARAGSKRQLDYGIGIDLQKMVEPTDDTSLKALSRAAEQMHDWFDDGHLLNVSPGAWCCLKADRLDVYSLNQLYDERTWETFIALSIRGFRT